MQKKHYFLPALHEKEYFKTQKTHNIDTEYLDGREIERLTMPDKRFLTNQPKWGIQNLGDSRGEFMYTAK